MDQLKKDLSAQYSEITEKAKSQASQATEKAMVWAVQQTRELKFYLLKFFLRVMIFLATFILYLTHREILIQFMNTPFFSHFTPFHIIWGIFMFLMILHLVPNNRLSMAWQKARERDYRPVSD